ncbi:MAG: thioredoxin domain-containing protein [Steroidobacter sp.]
MKSVVGVVMAVLFSVQVFAGNAPFTVVKLSSSGDLRMLLQQHEQQAEKQHEKLFVELDADWCIHCRKLNATLGDAKMQRAFRGAYIVQVDEDKWKNQLGSIGINPVGIPAFYQIDRDGMATTYTINGGAWGEDTVANMAPPLKKYFSNAK